MDEGRFGYRLAERPDGRTELFEPSPIEMITGRARPRGWLGQMYTPAEFATFSVLFIAAAALTALIVYEIFARRLGYSDFSGLVDGWVFVTTVWLISSLGLFNRSWRIRKGEITRYWGLKGVRIGRERPYKLSELEIRRQMSTKGDSFTDSFIGTGPEGEVSFVKRREKFHESLPLQDQITPEVWWLGHEIAKLSGFRLKIKESTIAGPLDSHRERNDDAGPVDPGWSRSMDQELHPSHAVAADPTLHTNALSEEQEAAVRARVATGDDQEAIAAEFGVSQSLVSKIALGGPSGPRLRAQKRDAKLEAERLSRQIEREAEDVDRWLDSIARIVRGFLDG